MRRTLWVLTLATILPFYANAVRLLAFEEPPSSYRNQNLRPEGYVIDIAKSLMEKTGQAYSIEFVPEARAYKIAEQTGAVLLGISQTKLRLHRFFWIGKIAEKNWEIYMRKDSPYQVNSISDLKKLTTLGVVRGDVREDFFLQRNFTNLISVTHHEQNIRKLLMDRIDAFAYERQGVLYQAHRLNMDIANIQPVLSINKSSVYIAMPAKSELAPLFETLHKGYVAIKDSGQLLQNSVYWQGRLQQQHGISSQIKDAVLVF